ncbi:mechanosensitive ion channel family protein [Fulvivirga sp. RKSG066]|uniref:mechanosensitive ion channel family protein n=1 Tax=Fulvivirga aurantia TaxID=2529383 RepID=UPI0012BB50BD|nr:mechanosensitive ion channel family protein [Fulvivirga aurantia]MTI20341.1 mechanosensitive ion channel family protein [Fulvivirga aurantia]
MSIDQQYIDYIIFPLAVLAGAFFLSRVLRYFIRRFVKRMSESMKLDPTKYNFLSNAINFIILILAVMVIFYHIPQLKQYGVGIFASAGVLAAIVGFASQSAFSNIVSGVFIVLFKPFRVGDHISLSKGNSGEVEDITLRHTVIKNYENRRIVIPNSIISDDTIVNSSLNEDKTCMYVLFGISYDSDIDLATKIMQEEAMKHPDILDNRSAADKRDGSPMVVVRLIDFGDSSVNLRAYVWATDPMVGFMMKCDLHKSIKKRFDAEGIEIPYPHRTIVYKDKKVEI